MPTTTIRDPVSGKKITITGDHVPTDTELDAIITRARREGSLPMPTSAAPPPRPTPSMVDKATTFGQQVWDQLAGTDPGVLNHAQHLAENLGLTPNASSATLNPVAQMIWGQLKGVGRTAVGAGELLDKYVPGVHAGIDAVTGLAGGAQMPTDWADQARAALAPTNAAQSAGQLLEQGAEFFGPGLATKGRVLASLTPTAGRLLPRLAAMAGQGAEAGAVAATQEGDLGKAMPAAAIGAGSGLITPGAVLVRQAPKLQASAERSIGEFLAPGRELSGQNVDKQFVKDNAERIISELPMAGFGALEKSLAHMQGAAENAWQRIDAVLAGVRQGNQAANLGDAVTGIKQAVSAITIPVQRGTIKLAPNAQNELVALTKEVQALNRADTSSTVLQRVQQRLGNLMTALPGELPAGRTAEAKLAGRGVQAASDAVTAALDDVRGSRVQTAPVLAGLKQALGGFQGVTPTGQTVTHLPQPVSMIQDLIRQIEAYGPDMSVDAARNIRQIWGSHAAGPMGRGFGETLADTTSRAASRTGTIELMKEIGNTVPAIKEPNADYSFWTRLGDIADRTLTRRTGQGKGLVQDVAGTVGAGVGLAQGTSLASKLLDAGMTATGMKLVARMMASPAWKLGSAKVKQEIAQALASGDATAINNAIRRGATAMQVLGTRGQGEPTDQDPLPQLGPPNEMGMTPGSLHAPSMSGSGLQQAEGALFNPMLSLPRTGHAAIDIPEQALEMGSSPANLGLGATEVLKRFGPLWARAGATVAERGILAMLAAEGGKQLVEGVNEGDVPKAALGGLQGALSAAGVAGGGNVAEGVLSGAQRLRRGLMAGGANVAVGPALALSAGQLADVAHDRFGIDRDKAERWLTLAGAAGLPAVAMAKGAKPGAELGKFPTTKPGYLLDKLGSPEANHGFSVNLQTGEEPTSGFMAGIYKNADPRTTVTAPGTAATPKNLKAHVATNAIVLTKPDMHLGGWRDPQTGPAMQDYLDVSKRFPVETEGKPQAIEASREDTKRKATKFAENTGQLAIAELKGVNPETGAANSPDFHPVGNAGEFLRSPEFQQRLDDMYQAGQSLHTGDAAHAWWDLYGGVLEKIYGRDRMQQLAGILASTSPRSNPVDNLRAATEYMRRLIKDEPLRQPDYRVPQDAMTRRGGMMFDEQSRSNNLARAALGDLDSLRLDKVNDMAHALIGDDVGVYDRQYAKLGEDPSRGIYLEDTDNVIGGSMDTGKISNYATMENAVRDAATRAGVPLRAYSATVWEGIRDTIRRTGELYGQKFKASAIPDTEAGFNPIAERLIAEKAKAHGMTPEAFMDAMSKGNATLLSSLLSTAAGWKLYQQWQQTQATDRPEETRPPQAAGAAAPR